MGSINPPTTDITVLKQLTAIRLDVNIWSARRKLTPADFTAAKDTFLGRYDQAIRDWIGQNPGWEKLIAGSLVGIDTVRARLGFAWQMFKIVPPKKGGKTDAGRPLLDAVAGLGTTLFGEVAKVADEAWHKSFAGKLEVIPRPRISDSGWFDACGKFLMVILSGMTQHQGNKRPCLRFQSGVT